jgi:hypothetical protein
MASGNAASSYCVVLHTTWDTYQAALRHEITGDDLVIPDAEDHHPGSPEGRRSTGGGTGQVSGRRGRSPPMASMKRIDVVKRKDGTWVGETNGRKVVGGATKAETVKAAAAKARGAKEPISLRIHKQDGKLQEERTYPRSADPRKSKG